MPLTGTDVTLEPQDASIHAWELYDASHSNDEALKIWDYLAYGPWPEVREKIAGWLKPSNFDAKGLPKSSLSETMKDRKPSTRRIE